ncbi:MAG: glycosyltransferase [bacterium]
MRKHGLYLFYYPNTDLRKEGLGRHLIELLKASREVEGVSFVVACPSWMRGHLLEVFEELGAAPGEFEILGPSRAPFLLRALEYYKAKKKKSKVRGWMSWLSRKLKTVFRASLSGMEKWLATTRGLPGILGFVFLGLPLILIILSGRGFALFFGLLGRKFSSLNKSLARKPFFVAVGNMLLHPAHSPIATRLFRLMETSEGDLMARMINARRDIQSWYCPTAFWPSFNQVTGPRLMCVPDMVMGEFPASFAREGEKALEHFKRVERAITGGSHFATYSETVKRNVLINRYHIPASQVQVIPHGAIRSDEWVTVAGFADDQEATENFCRNLFSVALGRAVNYPWAPLFGKGRSKFIFYASQFRPNKNLLTLLKAYEHLLRRRYLGHKLILTGDPAKSPEIMDFIQEKHLSADVLCLHGLTAQELAACYRLADLAVNPSLSEGGCPFTLTEALSVGTPVVMARIPVTEEIVRDPILRDATLFDPRDWKAMADKIEWAIQNREVLLEIQKPFYEKLAERSWVKVLEDYVAALDKLAASESQAKETARGE